MNEVVRNKLFSLAIIAFVLSTLTVSVYYLGFDAKVHDYFYPVNEGDLTEVVRAITFLGSKGGIISISIIFVLYFVIRKKYEESLFYLVSVFGATIANYELKNLFQRVRPEVYGTEFAFPSGHTMASTVAFGVLSLYLWPKSKFTSISILIFPLLIGFSRIYLDVHWLSDVLGGFCFGAIWLAITFSLFYGWKK